MRLRLPSSVLVLSVDWPSSSTATSQQQAFPADKLIRLLQRFQLASTWSLQDPHASPLPELLSHAGVKHDISLMVRDAWAGPRTDRRLFGSELQRLLAAAGDRGISIRSLAVLPGRTLPHLDLVRKFAVSSVREDDQRPTREQTGLPYALRHGLWNIPASRQLPDQLNWVWNPAGGTRRLIQSVASGQVGHIVIHGDQFTGRNMSDLRTLERLLRNLSEIQQAGRLNVETMSQFVEHLRVPERSSACSILRKAA
ncbi:MAG: hypothetical protein O2931_02495 [Planctomycetota bacterium]|nr:hypothetical protein [Planctomycetota bacterium]MDA1177644.1 hypothetical protein [Planctomycetota bacterium]